MLGDSIGHRAGWRNGRLFRVPPAAKPRFRRFSPIFGYTEAWRPAGAPVSQMKATTMPRSLQQAQQLQSADGDDAKQEMQPDFGVAAHPDETAAVVILQHRVHPLRRAALVVAARRGGIPRLRAAAARVGIDDRHVAQAARKGRDRLGVIGRIHQVVTVGHPLRAHLRQRNRRLRVVQRSRGENRADRDVAIDAIQMQFVAFPTSSTDVGVGMPQSQNVFPTRMFCSSSFIFAL